MEPMGLATRPASDFDDRGLGFLIRRTLQALNLVIMLIMLSNFE